MKKLSYVLAVGAIGSTLLGSPQLCAQGVLAAKGTQVEGALQQSIDSKTNHDGDRFTLVVKEGFFHKTPGLSGGTIEGHVENVTPASASHKATMNVVFDDIKMPNGSVAPIDAKVTSMSQFEPKTHRLRDAGIIMGTAVAGHMVSKRTGKKGGTIAGAAAGVALVSGLKSDIKVRKGTIVHLKLNADAVASR